MKSVSDKLAKFLDDNNLTQRKVAAILGVSEQYVNALVCGRRSFGRKTSAVWENQFGLSSSWLMTGEGEMLNRASGNGNNDDRRKKLQKVLDGIKFRYGYKTQKEILEKTEYSSVSNLSEMLNGKANISDNFLENLCKAYKINLDYFAGDGNIWIDDEPNTDVNPKENTDILSRILSEMTEQREMIEKHQEMIAKSQEQLDRLLDLIKEKKE